MDSYPLSPNWMERLDQSNPEVLKMLGPEITIGEHTKILTHCPNRMYREDSNIYIENYVWIGYGCIVLPSIRIRFGTILGAGSVLTQNTKPFSIYAGNPARFVRHRTVDEMFRYKALRKENRRQGDKFDLECLTEDDKKDVLGFPKEKFFYSYFERMGW